MEEVSAAAVVDVAADDIAGEIFPRRVRPRTRRWNFVLDNDDEPLNGLFLGIVGPKNSVSIGPST